MQHKQLWTTADGFEDGGRELPATELKWNLEAVKDCQPTASKQIGISVLQPQELELCQDPGHLGNGFKTQSLQKEMESCCLLDFSASEFQVGLLAGRTVN